MHNGIQMRWTWQQYCINIILAAFSLRELVHMRFYFTHWSTPGCRWRGGSLPPVGNWEGESRHAKKLPSVIGLSWCALYGSVPTPHSYASSSFAARDGSCAARRDTLLATHIALLGMTLLAMVLLSMCLSLFPSWHDEVDAMGGALVAATHARQRMIAVRTNILGLMSLLGKNLLHPVLPCLLVSDALYVYHCVDSRLGLFFTIFSILFSALLYHSRIWAELETWSIVSARVAA